MARIDIDKRSKPEVTKIGRLVEALEKIQIALAKGNDEDAWLIAERAIAIGTDRH